MVTFVRVERLRVLVAEKNDETLHVYVREIEVTQNVAQSSST